MANPPPGAVAEACAAAWQPFRNTRNNLVLQPAENPAKDLRRMIQVQSGGPIRGWFDNVTANAAIARDMALQNQVYGDYEGPAFGKFRQSNGEAVNKHLRYYITTKHSSTSNRKKRKAAEAFTTADHTDANTAAVHDGDQVIPEDVDVAHEELTPRRRPRPRTTRIVSEAEAEHLRNLLLSIRPMIIEGIHNAKSRTELHRHGLDADTEFINYESDDFHFTAHQKDGIGRWEHLVSLYGAMLLCDECGLGKTGIAIGVIQRRVDEAIHTGRSILIGVALQPALVKDWKGALGRSKNIRVCDYAEPTIRSMSPSEIKKAYDVVIIPCGTLRNVYSAVFTRFCHRQAIKEGLQDVVANLIGKPLEPDAEFDQTLLSLDLDQLIIDEGHVIKNAVTQLAMAMRAIPARTRAGLTGTPLQNNVNEFGDLLMFLGIPPFHNPGIYRAAFAHPPRKRMTAAVKEQNTLTDAALSSVRSAICIRRIKGQDFDGIAMDNGSDPPDDGFMKCTQSQESLAYQLTVRDLWDPEWKKAQQRLDRLDKEEAEDDDYDNHRPLRVPKRDNVLLDLAMAKMHIIHPTLSKAKYGTDGTDGLNKDDVSDLFGQEDVNPNDVTLARQALGFTGEDGEVQDNDPALFHERRTRYLAKFRSNEWDWRSDRTNAVVKKIKQRLIEHSEAAEMLPEGSQRNDYLARHKIVVFCEYMAGLDLVAIGLERLHINCLHYNGSISQAERRDNLDRFEEVGKVRSSPPFTFKSSNPLLGLHT